MAIMQMVVLACLGVTKTPGRSVVKLRKESPETVLSRRGLNKGRGKKVIFTVSNHSENETNRTGSMKQRSGLWNHLIWSYEQKVVRCLSSGTILQKYHHK